MTPLAVDLCAGLGGWTDGLLAEGYDVVGYDIERHKYGSHQYPAQLVLQDILTLDGRQFRGKVSLIVASPPCQKYSYMAMPWKRAKALAAWYRDPEHPERIVELNALFDACVRIGREAECPIVIENVCGAQPWVGRSRWAYGSFHLFGDVPALMPITFRMFNKIESPHLWLRDPKRAGGKYAPNYTKTDMSVGCDEHDDCCQGPCKHREFKNSGGSWFNVAHNTTSGKGQNPVGRPLGDETKGCGGTWFGANRDGHGRTTSPGSNARKAASARIAKIPFALSSWIAWCYYPRHESD